MPVLMDELQCVGEQLGVQRRRRSLSSVEPKTGFKGAYSQFARGPPRRSTRFRPATPVSNPRAST